MARCADGDGRDKPLSGGNVVDVPLHAAPADWCMLCRSRVLLAAGSEVPDVRSPTGNPDPVLHGSTTRALRRARLPRSEGLQDIRLDGGAVIDVSPPALSPGLGKDPHSGRQ